MGFPVAASTKNYSNTGANNTAKYIPEVWSAKLVEKFYDATVWGEITNTDYEGEITAYGDKVFIRTVPDITVSNYTKNGGLTYQQPESANVELVIDQGKSFSFHLFDVDKTQSDLNLMDEWAKDASERIKISIDTDILAAVYADAAAANAGLTAGRKSASINLGTTGAPLVITKANILDVLVDYSVVLGEQSCPESNRWVVIPEKMAGMIQKSDLKDASFSGDSSNGLLRNGRLGSIAGLTLYKSNNVHVASSKYDIIFGHKSAITFAAQMTHNETLRNPNDFGDLVRGLMVYGFETIKPESLGHSVVTLP